MSLPAELGEALLPCKALRIVGYLPETSITVTNSSKSVMAK